MDNSQIIIEIAGMTKSIVYWVVILTFPIAILLFIDEIFGGK
jgi:hypothetical protein